MKKLLKTLGLLALLLVLIAICLIAPNDQRKLEETEFYPKTMKNLQSLKLDGGYGSILKCGWAKENISPDFDVQIAGYGLRWKPYKAIHDSIFARVIVFENGKQKVVMITMDLLIAPPLVVEKVLPKLYAQGFKRENIYFGATHSHSSAGGWAEGLGGRGLAGPLNEKMIEKISNGIIAGVLKAQSKTSPCKIGFQKINAAEFVTNRLFGDKAPEDPWLRVVKIENENKETAMLLTYSAHPTCIKKKDNRISCDYPGMLTKDLEQSKTCQFAAFFAGAIGSMRPADNGFDGYEKAETISKDLLRLIKQHNNQIKTDTTTWISYGYLPMAMREPQLRVNDHFRLRPWVFNWMMGDQEIGVNVLRIGNLVWIGTPCDYSGEMMKTPDSLSEKINKNLLLTSFNGAYIGYITPDQYYDSVKYETREMNWYGPYNGRYFGEVVNGMLKKAGD